MPLHVRQIVLALRVRMIAEQHGQSALGEQKLFERVEDVLSIEYGAHAVERRG